MTVSSSRSWRSPSIVAAAALILPLMACSGDLGPTVKRAAFTSSEFGVSVSPRVTRNAHPPRGGGRYSSDKPYVVRGVSYTPLVNPVGYEAVGHASWYGADFHGRRTANGEIFSANAISGAHPTLPLPCYVRVTNLSNGRSLLVRINDRGPYMADRLIDLSSTAANMLGLIGQGTGEVQVNFVAMAPLEGDDTRVLKESLNRVTRIEQQANVRYAFAEPTPALDAMNTRGTFSLFSYADAGADMSSAELAIGMLAEGRGEEINLGLGVFAQDQAIDVATAFARLGAVDEEEVLADAGTATRLTLTRLKPGVARDDVVALVRELGLNGVVLY